MNVKSKIALLVGVAVLSGCASARDAYVTLDHSANTLAELDAAIAFSEVTRTMPEGVVEAQYETTGYDFDKQIFLTEPVVDNFRVALTQEMRRAGVTFRGDRRCEMKAHITHMGVEYQGSRKLAFSGNVDYHLVSPDQSETLDVSGEYVSGGTVPTVIAAYRGLMTNLADAFLESAEVQDFVATHCPKSG